MTDVEELKKRLDEAIAATVNGYLVADQHARLDRPQLSRG
jgi:hypothetical protein